MTGRVNNEIDELFDVGAATAARLRLSYAHLFQVEPWRAVGKEFGLTPRELQIGIFMAKGYTQRWIAGRLDIAVTTVQNHRKRILLKLRCHSTNRAILKMILATGLLFPEDI